MMVVVLLTPVVLLNLIFAPPNGMALPSSKRTTALNGVPATEVIGLALKPPSVGPVPVPVTVKTTDWVGKAPNEDVQLAVTVIRPAAVGVTVFPEKPEPSSGVVDVANTPGPLTLH